MKKFDTRVYSVSDFIEWDSSGLLDLSPEFQRRSVWGEKAKSYLIDTIIRGKPIPKVLITQELKGTRNIRVVVDGQQRLRAILEFLDDGFKISKAHHHEYAGKKYSSLPDQLKHEILKYEVGVDLLFDASYADILDIFARLNTFSVRLNNQEQLNAKYLGFFKQTAYKLGYDYVDYWVLAGILSKSQVSRMAEATLASDLLVALVDGIQTNKNIPTLYKRLEDEEGPLEKKEELFHQTMSVIGEIYSALDLKNSNFSRIHLFYSLFCSIAHFISGVKGLEETPKVNIKNNTRKARVRLDEISYRYDEDDESPNYQKFIDYSRRATTDTSRRIFRSQFICDQIIEAIKG
ncbi:MAG: DUF262 domain-containing protein [Alcanivorax sp.]|uniref:DUF262 domain-containing protein n=1 Tax=Alloalcanivorax marinus TaxID=1177169 RepID=UPI001958A2EB|nr:DUF262 domain-containing protein [Alloalcanivorax marinus]MBM7332850.1 DUF262 domain-containing protein [Alloalcanivorax marinus]